MVCGSYEILYLCDYRVRVWKVELGGEVSGGRELVLVDLLGKGSPFFRYEFLIDGIRYGDVEYFLFGGWVHHPILLCINLQCDKH